MKNPQKTNAFGKFNFSLVDGWSLRNWVWNDLKASNLTMFILLSWACQSAWKQYKSQAAIEEKIETKTKFPTLDSVRTKLILSFHSA